MSNPIWLNEPTILLKHKQIKNIWPLSSMSHEDKINSITRLLILLSLIGYFLTSSFKMFYLSFITISILLIIFFIQNKKKSRKIPEGFSNSLTDNYEINKEDFSKPTPNNPLMNVLLPEIYYEPERKPAAPTFNKDVNNEINKSVQEFITKEFDVKDIDKKLFHDLGDKLAFDRSMIPFNGSPNTQVPNDQDSYQKFLYGNMPSRKENNTFSL